MALNPFFLQGSSNEQYLVQDLINEQLKIYGIDVHYIPRKFLKTDDILNEVESSKFDDNFVIEAYLDNYEGYAPGSDIMSKFGLRLKNEINIVISRERYEEFITPFLQGRQEAISDGNIDDYELELISRPKEGDLIYFPLGQRLFEVKRVEHEKPFYQLGKNYVYELQCELYEYENEDIDTSIEEIDRTVADEGYITTLILGGIGVTATATSSIDDGVVSQIVLTDDGSFYSSVPTVTIADSPTGIPADKATAVAITTSIGGVRSVSSIRLTFGGRGYSASNPPLVTITGGNGTGAAATAIVASTGGVNDFTLTNPGSEYYLTPTVSISPPANIGAAATATVSGGRVTAFTVTDGGEYYKTAPTVTVGNPIGTSTGVIYGDVNVDFFLSNAGGTVQQNTGTGYIGNTTYDLVGGNGTGATLSVTTVGAGGTIGPADGLSIAYGGQDYDLNDVLRIDGGNQDGYIRVGLVTTRDNVTATGIATITSGIVTSITITNPGTGYTVAPDVSISNDIDEKTQGVEGGPITVAQAVINPISGTLTDIQVVSSGYGYTTAPTVQISSASTVSIGGTYLYNETVTGSLSGTQAEVRSYDQSEGDLKVAINTGQFSRGEVITGAASSATYILKSYDNNSFEESYDANEEFETEADGIIDFTETNPFGEY